MPSPKQGKRPERHPALEKFLRHLWDWTIRVAELSARWRAAGVVDEYRMQCEFNQLAAACAEYRDALPDSTLGIEGIRRADECKGAARNILNVVLSRRWNALGDAIHRAHEARLALRDLNAPKPVGGAAGPTTFSVETLLDRIRAAYPESLRLTAEEAALLASWLTTHRRRVSFAAQQRAARGDARERAKLNNDRDWWNHLRFTLDFNHEPETKNPADPIPLTWLRQVVPSRTVKGDPAKLAAWLGRKGRDVAVFKIGGKLHAERTKLLDPKVFGNSPKVAKLIREYTP